MLFHFENLKKLNYSLNFSRKLSIVGAPIKGPWTWNCLVIVHWTEIDWKLVDVHFHLLCRQMLTKIKSKLLLKLSKINKLIMQASRHIIFNIVHFFCSSYCRLMTLVFTTFFWQALLAEGRFYSDLELTEKEIERSVMEASRAEYLAGGTLKHQRGHRESSTSTAEPSSSGAS